MLLLLRLVFEEWLEMPNRGESNWITKNYASTTFNNLLHDERLLHVTWKSISQINHASIRRLIIDRKPRDLKSNERLPRVHLTVKETKSRSLHLLNKSQVLDFLNLCSLCARKVILEQIMQMIVCLQEDLEEECPSKDSLVICLGILSSCLINPCLDSDKEHFRTLCQTRHLQRECLHSKRKISDKKGSIWRRCSLQYSLLFFTQVSKKVNVSREESSWQRKDLHH